MARPKKDIKAEEVQKLAAMQCTNVEIAAFFDVDEGTIRKRFPEQIAKGKEIGKMSIRRAQFNLATGGNATMLIWLGKQYLGQTEKLESAGGEELINQELSFDDVPLNGDGKHRFAKFVQ
jgi:hypothetical protein